MIDGSGVADGSGSGVIVGGSTTSEFVFSLVDGIEGGAGVSDAIVVGTWKVVIAALLLFDPQPDNSNIVVKIMQRYLLNINITPA